MLPEFAKSRNVRLTHRGWREEMVFPARRFPYENRYPVLHLRYELGRRGQKELGRLEVRGSGWQSEECKVEDKSVAFERS